MPKPTRSKKVRKTTTKKAGSKVEKDFDQFRHEVYKFGLTGLDKKDQVDARVELALKLGAKSKSWINPHKDLATLNKEKNNQNKHGASGKID